MDLAPGDWVEKVGPDVAYAPRGALSVVVELTPLPESRPPCGVCGDRPSRALQIRDYPLGNRYLGWCACAWRPVSRKSDFDRLLETLRTSAHDLAPPNPVPA